MTSFVVVLGGTALAATAQTVAGFGFALIAMPLFVIVLDVPHAVGVAAVLSFVNASIVASSARAHVVWPIVRLLFLGSLCGMPLGLALLLGTSGDLLRVAVGIVSIVMALAIGASYSLGAPGRAGTLGVGLISGVLTTSIAINGPPVVLFLQALGFSPETFRASLSTFFVVNGLVSLTIFLLSGVIDADTMPLVLAALPTLVLGHVLGHLLLPRFEATTFRRFVLALLVVSASVSLLDGLSRLAG